jgi:hypothetical protein
VSEPAEPERLYSFDDGTEIWREPTPEGPDRWAIFAIIEGQRRELESAMIAPLQSGVSEVRFTFRSRRGHA